MLHSQLNILISLLMLSKVCVTQIGLTKCECVARNKCHPNLEIDDDFDIRIVNGDNPTTRAISTSPCTNGLIECCTECGISYNITSALNPATGQGLYGAQPWQAVILDNQLNYIGGGALIDEKHVLTAAHKVYEFRNKPTSILVRLGEWDAARDNVEPFRPQDSIVTRIFFHESYLDSAKNLYNDVAVLRLATRIRYGPGFNPAINTACLPNSTTNFSNIRCVVSGWGKNAFNGSYQSIIREVDVPVVDNTVCETRLRTTKLGTRFILDTKSFICAGGEPGKDACVGDGGSPLMCKVGNRYQVAGLVAWGIGCANENIPGVYVRVQSYLDFIIKSIFAP